MKYVISDLHGCPVDIVRSLFKRAGFCGGDDCYVLGDVIDRGPDGIALLRIIMNDPRIKMILGNHEKMMLECGGLIEGGRWRGGMLTPSEEERLLMWRLNGGEPTLKALEECDEAEVKDILEYLSAQPVYRELTVGGRRFILTHSGIGHFDSSREISDYPEDDLLWTRPSISERYYNDRTVVFGHTPTVYYGEKYYGVPVFTDTWIDIDVGCAMGLTPALLRLDDMKVFTVNR